jgi:hypothetical protein
MTIYNRLEFNFDKNKFGNAKDLPKQSIDYYKILDTNLKDWQYDDVSNDTVDITQYFKNPVANVSLSIQTSANLLFQSSNGVVFQNNETTGNLIPTTAQTLTIEMQQFKRHTDNVSGVSSEPMFPGIPSYDLIVAVGNEITRIVVNEDDITDTSGVLGSATSLFVGSDLNQYLTILTSDISLVNNSISVITTGDPENPETILVSNLTSQQVNSVYSNVSTLYTLVNGRRLHDWNFFENSLDVLMDVSMVTRFSSVGNLQKTLINEYIGTEKLKNIIANT